MIFTYSELLVMSDPLQVTTPDPLSDKIEDEEDSVSAGVEPKNNDLSEIFTDAVGGKDTAGINFFDSFQQNSQVVSNKNNRTSKCAMM